MLNLKHNGNVITYIVVKQVDKAEISGLHITFERGQYFNHITLLNCNYIAIFCCLSVKVNWFEFEHIMLDNLSMIN